MKKILIATTNPAKREELKTGLKNLEKQGIEILTLNDVKVGENEPAETGKTFQENALIKAKYYADRTHLPCLSDDGGLVIPYLNNEPGVKSKRWLGYEATDEKLIRHTLSHLHGITSDNRIAYLEICLCFYVPPDVILTERSEWKNLKKRSLDSARDDCDGIVFFETEKITGHIANIPSSKKIPGFPYRAIFIVDKFNKYYDDLTEVEHQEINHRLKAVKKLTNKIINLI